MSETRVWQQSVVDNASFFLKRDESKVPERCLVWVQRKAPDVHTRQRPEWGQMLIKRTDTCNHVFTVCDDCLSSWLVLYDMDWQRTEGGKLLAKGLECSTM